jgi:5-formyltetrahydrofolate cyclo-ligase
MSTAIIRSKDSIRNRLRGSSKSVPAAKRASLSVQMCALLEKQPIWQEARCVLFYVPAGTEPDISPLLAQALAEGKTVAIPRYVSKEDHYDARQIKNLKRDLVAGQFSILEPRPGCPIVPLNQLDLALVPGVGFDLSGCRLGRGKGFYDRLLGQVPGHKCGLAFDWQIVKEIPWEPHDIRLNSILTPTRWHIVVS